MLLLLAVLQAEMLCLMLPWFETGALTTLPDLGSASGAGNQPQCHLNTQFRECWFKPLAAHLLPQPTRPSSSCQHSSPWVYTCVQATNNSFIWAPNAVGALLGLLQLTLCLIFPRKMRVDPEDAAKREPLLSRTAEEERANTDRAGDLLHQRRGSSAAEDV